MLKRCVVLLVVAAMTFSKEVEEEEPPEMVPVLEPYEGFGFLGWKFGELAYERCKENKKLKDKKFRGSFPTRITIPGVCDNMQEAVEMLFDEVVHS